VSANEISLRKLSGGPEHLRSCSA